MTVARRRGLYVASVMGAVAAGFASHWIVPSAVKEAPAAQPSSIDQRLQSIDLTLAEMSRRQANIERSVDVIKCRLNIEGTCPPDGR